MKGYDVASFEEDGQERPIEVKCVSSDSFFISANEVDASREIPNYQLYLVDASARGGVTLIIVPTPVIADGGQFSLEPIQYRARFRLSGGGGDGVMLG